jgi:hypothetical protein
LLVGKTLLHSSPFRALLIPGSTCAEGLWKGGGLLRQTQTRTPAPPPSNLEHDSICIYFVESRHLPPLLHVANRVGMAVSTARPRFSWHGLRKSSASTILEYFCMTTIYYVQPRGGASNGGSMRACKLHTLCFFARAPNTWNVVQAVRVMLLPH